jgi:hypothetical protein
VHTITFDNGMEFAAHQDIAHALKTKIFFATPYHAWERGLNEQPLDTAIHPGGSTCCTCAAAIRRGVAATQNSDCAPLIALTTWTTFENTFFMSVVPLISGRESNPAVSWPMNIRPKTTAPSDNLL